jgi:hypothetical protein
VTALPDFLGIVPDPVAVHRRLGEAIRAERLLRRLLHLALAARVEDARRAASNQSNEGASALVPRPVPKEGLVGQ